MVEHDGIRRWSWEDSCGQSLLQELPDDVLALISGCMQPRDLCNLSSTCRKLRSLCDSDKLWLPHCESLAPAQVVDLMAWRSALPSFKALCRFLHSVKPLIGIWVHQNPELGNMVYVTWGFVSVVACRIIPQELGPRGLDQGLLWAPVFEIIGNTDGSLAFFLHGRDRDKDFCYPGRFKPSRDDPNVLLLEAEPLLRSTVRGCLPTSPDSPLAMVAPMPDNSDDSGEDYNASGRMSCRGTISRAAAAAATAGGGKGKQKVAGEPVPFHRLAFGDRRRLLEHLAPHVGLSVPESARGPLFLNRGQPHHFEAGPGWDGHMQQASSSSKQAVQRDLLLLSERRLLLMWMYSHGDPCAMEPESGSQCEGVDSESLHRALCCSSDPRDGHGGHSSSAKSSKGSGEKSKASTSSSTVGTKRYLDSAKKLGFAKFVQAKMKQIIGKTTAQDHLGRSSSSSSSSVDSKRLQLQEFLKQGHSVGLRLHATSWKLSFYRAWPIMHDNRFALYKMPEQKPEPGRELAGLWGGTFGWPPGRPTDDKPGKALFFLLLSYDQTDEGSLLIGTKILEGTHYVLHPNGSAMFTAKMQEPSSQPFPWEQDKDGNLVDIVDAFQGEGIANGYGFRYPGSKPGDLFVEAKGTLAFVWRESKAVLTLQRLNLQALLEQGERVAALPAVANFAYLTKSYSNVFAGYCGVGPNSGIGLGSITLRSRSSETRR